jgi:hypothetical protein
MSEIEANANFMIQLKEILQVSLTLYFNKIVGNLTLMWLYMGCFNIKVCLIWSCIIGGTMANVIGRR